jgi:hypothetical protein
MELDIELEKLQLPASVIPIRLISFNSYLAVKYFRNRESTFDVDYVLNPELENINQIKQAIKTAIFAIAKARDCQPT